MRVITIRNYLKDVDMAMVIYFLFILFLFLSISCYDSKIKHPDGNGGGYVYTKLGAFIYGPWEYDSSIGNVAVFSDSTEVYSKRYIPEEIEKNLIFELQENKTVVCWMKHDSTVQFKGNWSFDENDSLLRIDFGLVNLPAMKRKYVNLDLDLLSLQRVVLFDSIYNGQKKLLTKVITTNFRHPWYNHI
jgi:hypothetical protein